MASEDVLIYDTTLRDGTQGEQINFTAEEKLRIAQRLDDAGFHYIEGGWPGSNPKDLRFFELAKGVTFKKARLTAFGSTRKPCIKPEDCSNLQALLATETPAVTIFGKSWDLHVTEILQTTLAESLAMAGSAQDFQPRSALIVVADEAEGNRIKSLVKPPSRVLVSSVTGGTAQAVAEKQLADALFQWLRDSF